VVASDESVKDLTLVEVDSFEMKKKIANASNYYLILCIDNNMVIFIIAWCTEQN